MRHLGVASKLKQRSNSLSISRTSAGVALERGSTCIAFAVGKCSTVDLGDLFP
jgi:hypothetical protein